MTTRKERAQVHTRLERMGIGYEDACTLRRIAMTLHRWFEDECGNGNAYASWSIERDEQTGKPYRCIYRHAGPSPHGGMPQRVPIPDREAGAKKRLHALMKKYPTLTPYIQTDPRGASLYLVAHETLTRYNLPIDQCYNHGTAVF